MITVLWNLLFFVITLGVLVTFHEYGHFWVARRNGIKVLRFSIGFGKPLCRWEDSKGTEYVIAAIPLGGYVRMLDERVDEVAAEERHLSFNNKSVWQRMSVVAAGPAANILLAIIAYWLVFMLGIPSVRPVVGEVTTQSIAAQAGMNSDERILEVDGRNTPDWQAVNLALVRAIGAPQITIFTGNENGDPIRHYQLDTRNWNFDPDKENAIASLGIKPFSPTIHNVVQTLGEGSAAAAFGLMVGDRITAIGGQMMTTWQQLVDYIRHHPDQQTTITVIRQGELVSLSGDIGSRQAGEQTVGFLGISPQVDQWPDRYLFEQQYGPVAALKQGIAKTWDLVDLSVSMVGKLLVGEVSVKSLSGPVSIAKGAGESASFGIVYFLGFMALISINLGIINLLPLPVLDGGHLLYYFIELFSGRPVPERVQEVGFKIGSLLLVMLMGLALFNDFSRL